MAFRMRTVISRMPAMPTPRTTGGIAANIAAPMEDATMGRIATTMASDAIADLDKPVDSAVPWYDYSIHPAKRLAYWLFRQLRKIPEEWRSYYRRLMFAEFRANTMLNVPWDIFMVVSEGYRKGKWVVRKYGTASDEAAIPYPYNNFWDVTTHEERAWAHRRSFQLKELQGMQREDCDAWGAIPLNSQHVVSSNVEKFNGSKESSGQPVHAFDLPSPKESQIRDDQEWSHILMATMEDDRMWNPSLRAKESRVLAETKAELFAFEDEGTDEEAVADAVASTRELPDEKTVA